MMKSIEFDDREGWTAVCNRTERDVASYRNKMSMPWRLWELCCARMNNWGHASFKRGELATLACGEDSTDNRKTVRRGLSNLADMGRVMPVAATGTTELCVVVNQQLAQRARGKGSRNDVCYEPGHEGHRDQSWPIRAVAAVPAPPVATVTGGPIAPQHNLFVKWGQCAYCLTDLGTKMADEHEKQQKQQGISIQSPGA